MSSVTYSVGDTFSFLDGLSLFVGGSAAVQITDLFYPQDSNPPVLGIGYVELVADSVALSDFFAFNFKMAIPVGPDRFPFLDDVQVALDSGRIEIFVQDHFNFADSRQSASPFVTAVSDTLSLSDAVGILSQYIVGDTLNFSDAVATGLASIFFNLTVQIGDSLSLSDTVQLNSSVKFLLLSDSLRLVDAVFVNLGTLNIPYLRRYLNDVQN